MRSTAKARRKSGWLMSPVPIDGKGRHGTSTHPWSRSVRGARVGAPNQITSSVSRVPNSLAWKGGNSRLTYSCPWAPLWSRRRRRCTGSCSRVKSVVTTGRRSFWRCRWCSLSSVGASRTASASSGNRCLRRSRRLNASYRGWGTRFLSLLSSRSGDNDRSTLRSVSSGTRGGRSRSTVARNG